MGHLTCKTDIHYQATITFLFLLSVSKFLSFFLCFPYSRELLLPISLRILSPASSISHQEHAPKPTSTANTDPPEPERSSNNGHQRRQRRSQNLHPPFRALQQRPLPNRILHRREMGRGQIRQALRNRRPRLRHRICLLS